MPARKKPIAEENPLFKWIIIINFVVLIGMLGLMVFTVTIEQTPPTDMQKGLFDFARSGAMVLIGTFAGLASAKAGRASHLADGLPQSPRSSSTS